MEQIGTKVYLNTDYEAALVQVTEALKAEGFGVLTEIDVRATLKNKLDVDFRPYKILGACNPPLAHQALSAVPDTGLLLPCNVTVAQEEDGRILVSIINPVAMLSLLADPGVTEVAQEVAVKLARVAAALR